MRGGTLRDPRCMRDVGDALGTLHEGVQNLETRWVSEDLKEVGEAEERLLARHLEVHRLHVVNGLRLGRGLAM